MEIKQLLLIIAVPLLLVSSVFLAANTDFSITGFVTAQDEKYEKLGTYTINPSFKAKIDYNMEQYSTIKEELITLVNNCKDLENREQCISDNTPHNWQCDENTQKSDDAIEDGNAILTEFIDKFEKCMNSEEYPIVCKFELSERENIDIPSNFFDIRFVPTITPQGDKIMVELVLGTNILDNKLIDLETLFYTGFINRDDFGTIVDKITFNIDFTNKKPVIQNAFANSGSDILVMERQFIFFKTGKDIKFIDDAESTNFEAPDPDGTIGLPKIINLEYSQGLKFCAKTGAKIMAYDESDNEVKLREIIYNFAVTFPKPVPKPISGLESFDYPNSTNKAILMWDTPEEEVYSFSVFYSTARFIDELTKNIRLSPIVTEQSFEVKNTLEIEDLDPYSCKIDPIGKLCKFKILESPLNIGQLYYIKSKEKYLIVLPDLLDSLTYNVAVIAVDEEGNELKNNRFLENNEFILKKGVNYGAAQPLDDLAPNKVQSLGVRNAGDGSYKLVFLKPQTNLDGTKTPIVNGFNIYYKAAVNADFTNKIAITVSQALCEREDLDCEFNIDSISTFVKGQDYDFMVTAFDLLGYEYAKEAEVVRVTI
jgi:hypothetical protein